MRALVTGGNGFVGRYLCAELRLRGATVVSAARAFDGPGVDVPLDLSDLANVRGVVELSRPDVIFHLAAQAFVPQATREPLETYDTNVMGTARLVDALRALPDASRPRLVFVSSGEVYGVQGPAQLPLRESTLPAPATTYAASKLAGEAIVLASARAYGLRAIVTRAFNHIGPGQSDRFVVAAFAKRLAAIAAGGDPLFPVGNLTPQRDFLDVRDVVRAYADLAVRGSDGEIYNVCSGTPTRISEILRTLVTFARVGVEIREDPALVRPVDVPIVYGDRSKLEAATGWAPTHTLARSLRDTYEAALADTATRA
jgi:GDP-4-dehydro-6-deoxy-D-mannose reductase